MAYNCNRRLLIRFHFRLYFPIIPTGKSTKAMILFILEFTKALISFFTGIPANWDEQGDDWHRQRRLDEDDEYE